MPLLPRLAQADAAPPEGIYDIVVPSPERPLWPLLLSILLALLFAAGIVLLVRHLLRARAGGAPPVPPGERARRELDRIEREHDELSPNRCALALSETLKNYLAARFHDRVRYETTEEFLARLSREGASLPPAAQQALRDILTSSEEVKFGQPADAAARTRPLLRQARDLVGLCESISAPDGRRDG